MSAFLLVALLLAELGHAVVLGVKLRCLLVLRVVVVVEVQVLVQPRLREPKRALLADESEPSVTLRSRALLAQKEILVGVLVPLRVRSLLERSRIRFFLAMSCLFWLHDTLQHDL